MAALCKVTAKKENASTKDVGKTKQVSGTKDAKEKKADRTPTKPKKINEADADAGQAFLYVIMFLLI